MSKLHRVIDENPIKAGVVTAVLAAVTLVISAMFWLPLLIYSWDWWF